MALDEQTYLMHRLALEGSIFFHNELAEPKNVRLFFPPYEGQEDAEYKRDPHIAFPITGDTINRVASLIHGGMKIECENKTADDVMQAIMERCDWNELSRDLLTKPMSTGNHLVVLRSNFNGEVYFEQWPGEYAFRDTMFGMEWFGYMFLPQKDGTMQPITHEPKVKDPNLQPVIVFIDEYLFGEVEHGFGFAPGVFIRGVDKDETGRYALPYHLRFRELNLEYNKIYSQMAKAMRILQNVWETNADRENPTNQLSMTPSKINYVGQDGFVRQVGRELDLTWESNTLDRLKAQISASAQVPDFMTGLTGVGKVESGVALQIVSGPLMELVSRIRSEYIPKIRELLTKAVTAEFMLKGKSVPVFEITIDMNESVLPVDKKAELDMYIAARQNGFITPAMEEAVSVAVAGLLGIEIAQ